MKNTLATLAATVLPAFAMAAGTTTPMADASATANVGVTGNYDLGGNSVNMGGNSIGLKASNDAIQTLTGTLNQTGTLSQSGMNSSSFSGGTFTGGSYSYEEKRQNAGSYASSVALGPCNTSGTSVATSIMGVFSGAINTSSARPECPALEDGTRAENLFSKTGEGAEVGQNLAMQRSPEVATAVEGAANLADMRRRNPEVAPAEGDAPARKFSELTRIEQLNYAHKGYSNAQLKEVKVAPASVSFGN